MLDFGFVHLLADDLLEPLVARQAEEEIDMIFFAPGHRLLAAEAGVAAQHDLHFRPARTQLRDDALDLVEPARGPVHVGRAQARAE